MWAKGKSLITAFRRGRGRATARITAATLARVLRHDATWMSAASVLTALGFVAGMLAYAVEPRAMVLIAVVSFALAGAITVAGTRREERKAAAVTTNGRAR